MKYFIIAGEASGDQHGANLMREIKKLDENAVFEGMGGDMMRAENCTLVQDYRNMAFMGFVAVAMNLRKIRQNFHIAKKAIIDFQPDHLILIDYPSFNLKIADFCKQNLSKTKITYYIPPKIWAWKTWRVHKIAKLSDNILGIFPFEPDFYARYGYKAQYVGNPTKETIAQYTAQNPVFDRKHQIVLVPGSRKYEVEKCLPIMLQATKLFSAEYKIIITQAPTLDDSVYTKIIEKSTAEKGKNISLTRDTYDAIRCSEAAIVNSGTATLETALLGTPQVAVYHVEFPHLMGALRNILFSIPHFTLVNIIAGREVIRELLAYEFTAENVRNELTHILFNPQYRRNITEGYREINQILGSNHAASTAARMIY